MRPSRTVPKPLTAAEQLAEFRAGWEAKNGTLAGRAADEEEAALPPRPLASATSAVRPASVASPKPLRRQRPSGQQAAVLRGAKTLPGPFSDSELVVAAWKHCPALLGLPGHEDEYPSDRRVYLTLVGKRGLIASGLLRRTAEGLLEVVGGAG